MMRQLDELKDMIEMMILDSYGLGEKSDSIVPCKTLLRAWSNGRMHPVKHRVMMRGEKERISLGIFPVPTEGTIIKPPKELIDEEHPQIFKEFDFMEFFKFFSSEEGVPIDSAKQIFAFAGICT
ncbi:unnamed protein product [Prunus armeniaca]